jgi:hypothetical protein
VAHSGRHTVSVLTWQLDDECVTVWDELDSTDWVPRHIEAKNADQVYTAAASLEEAITARDTGGVGAVRSYEKDLRRGALLAEALFHADHQVSGEPVHG